MTTITIDSDDQEVIKAVKELLKERQTSFTVEDESPYDPEFVKMIKESERQAAEGNTVKYEPGTRVWEILNAQ